MAVAPSSIRTSLAAATGGVEQTAADSAATEPGQHVEVADVSHRSVP
jgi:hypothetical protein